MPKIRGIDYQQLEDALNKVGINTDTKESVLTIVPPADFTATGTTAANASTTIAGSSTLFLTEAGIGDRISLSSAATTFATVTAIASDTSLTVDVALGNGTSQTILIKKSLFRADTTSQTNAVTIDDRGTLITTQTFAPGAVGTPQPRGIFTSSTLVGDSSHGPGFVGVRSQVTRTITTSQTDTNAGMNALAAVSPVFNVPTGQTYSNNQATAGYAAVSIGINPTITGGGSLNIGTFVGINIANSTVVTGTTKTGLQILGVSGATNNAFIADNNGYSGNYFINSSSTNPSVLSGNLKVGDPTQTNRFNVGNSTFTNDSLSTIATMEGGADGSLGSMRLQYKIYPSATATNRYASINAGDGANNRVLALNDGGGTVITGASAYSDIIQGAGGAVSNGIAIVTAPATSTNTAQLRTQSTGTNHTRISLGVDNTNAYIMAGGSNTNPPIIFSNNDSTTALMTLTNAGVLQISSNATVGSSSAGATILTIQSSLTNGNRQIVLKNTSGSPTSPSWTFGSEINTTGIFEITPSTANGGTSFTFPALQLKMATLNSATGVNFGFGVAPLVPFHVNISGVSGTLQTLTNITTTGNNWIKFTSPVGSVGSSIGLMLRQALADSDSRLGAGMIVSGLGNNGQSTLDLFVSGSSDGGSTSVLYSMLQLSPGTTGAAAGGTITSASQLSMGNNITLSSGTTNQNRLILQVGGVTKGQIGSATGSGDIITGSATNDLCIRSNSSVIRLSSDNGVTSAIAIDAGGTTTAKSTTAGLNRVMGDANNLTASIGASGGTFTPTISSANSAGIFIVTDATTGASALMYYFFTNGLTIVSQSGAEFAVTASPSSSQTGLQYVSSTGVLTVKNGFAATRQYVVTVYGT